MLPKGPFLEYLRRGSPLPAFLCGTPEMRWTEGLFLPEIEGMAADPGVEEAGIRVRFCPFKNAEYFTYV